jgi:hypothetical protein
MLMKYTFFLLFNVEFFLFEFKMEEKTKGERECPQRRYRLEKEILVLTSITSISQNRTVPS